MSDFTPDRDWTYGYGSEDGYVLVRQTPHGVFRARLELDTYADAPEFEAGCPVYRLTNGYSVELEDRPEYGAESDKHSGVDFPRAFDYFYNRDQLDALNRWLAIFHGGSVDRISSTVYQGGDEYLVYDTRAMREWWGQTGEALETSKPEAAEWQSYIDGDVYVVHVERAFDFDDDGEPAAWEDCDDSPVGGYYGELWAQQAAEEMLDDEVEHTAAAMLPLATEEV